MGIVLFVLLEVIRTAINLSRFIGYQLETKLVFQKYNKNRGIQNTTHNMFSKDSKS